MEFLAPALVISLITLTLGATFILRGPLGKALADRMAGRAARDDADVAQLRAEVDDLRDLVGELQERLDFAERLLAQQRERSALPDR
ncbi:MAG: hypothetical protein A3K13_09885 [Gemmatimonadetes bacterium RIFCSPLOWO2_12_FULL_68_9]|nr:MAG: hypothetical protein A3K13_09885 [Gemmatimonadetes bacterium RIFCSPLOWO2_12_FULL_68_9]